MGIPPSKLLGREPAEVTSFEYDDDGRMVRAVTVREPEYTFLDRAWLLDSWKQANVPRGSHGWPMSVATDPANQGKFFVGLPAVDFAAKAEIEAKEDAEKAYKGKIPLGALKFQVEKRD